MARAEWWGSNGRAKWCSYKRTTIVVCSINIFVALYVLHSYTSAYMYTGNDTQRAFRYTPDQVSIMEESNQIRKQLEPVELIEVIKGLKEEFYLDEKVLQVPQHIKQNIADEILATLKGVNAGDNATAQRGDYAFSLRASRYCVCSSSMLSELRHSQVRIKESCSGLTTIMKMMFKEIGDICGGWMETEEETILKNHLRWALIKSESYSRGNPKIYQEKAAVEKQVAAVEEEEKTNSRRGREVAVSHREEKTQRLCKVAVAKEEEKTQRLCKFLLCFTNNPRFSLFLAKHLLFWLPASRF
ncbi:hypothetical protein HAX54_030167 [Datura stramonium]|uniref:Uncharacterized protein n=1 Tax=Datura stramonium TaxID=4076 RepID=A0ABS8VA36_DATST|nr:hypothetical protein [Datura stramonium]